MTAPQRSDSAALKALCDQGLALHQAGRLDQAAPLYQQVLAADPFHFDALHFLGVLCLQTGQPGLGVQCIQQAVSIQPRVAIAHANLGNGLNTLGRHQEAVEACGRAIALDPRHAEAHGTRAQALYQLHGAEAALPGYAQVVALKPSAKAHCNHGLMLRELGRFEEALASFDRCIALAPGHADAHRSRGIALRALGRPQEALLAYDRAIAARPDYAEAHDNRGNVLCDLDRHADALASFDLATSLRPDYAEAFSNKAAALRGLGRPDLALDACDRAIALDPGYAEAHNNRASALFDFQRLDEALVSCERAIALKPTYAAAWNSKGVVLHLMRRLDEALAAFDEAIALDPRDAEAHYNQAMVRLTLGDYERGWAQYQSRWDTRQFKAMARDFGAPLWLGDEDVSGRTVLVHAEQGLGDTLQFCRYVPELAARGAKVIFEVQAGLERLAGRLDGVHQVVIRGEPLPAHDFQAPLLSLPLALKAGPEASSHAYLSADPQAAEAWAARLAQTEGLRVGLCWAGGTRPDQAIAHAIDRRRSLELSAFAPLAALDGVRFYSLQKGPPAAQLADLGPRWTGLTIIDLTAELDDFADTAALVENLDLVISCDTSTAHLAGALGKPVWVLNRFDACWRWLSNREDSPWYPSARLFWQGGPGDWDGVVTQVARDLAALAAGAVGRA